jgi:hypothetical protein
MVLRATLHLVVLAVVGHPGDVLTETSRSKEATPFATVDLSLLPESFGQHMCDADGVCHETPSKATARTVYTARSAKQSEQWFRFQKVLAGTAEKVADQWLARAKGATRLILLGDSITESFRGTSYGTVSVSS